MTDPTRPPDGDPILRWLPTDIAARLRPPERTWRGRLVLWLWAIGYPLPMAVHLATTDDRAALANYRAMLAALDDETLEVMLAETEQHRAGEPSLTFLALARADARVPARGVGAERTRGGHVSWSAIKRAKGVRDP